MVLIITLTLTLLAGYLKVKLHEEVESLFAGLIALICLFLSLVFAPLSIKFLLLTLLLFNPSKNFKLIDEKIK
jgi:hypothetical protein